MNEVKKYSIIYADPPWKCWGGGKKNASRHYPCMKLEDIKALPIKALAAEDCVLFLWAISPMLPGCLEVIKSWGFKYSTVAFYWIKTRSKGGWHMGLGGWTRANPEIVLLGTRGHPKRVDKSVPNLVIEQLREHSRKPDEVRDRIVRLMGDLPRIELFGREKVGGWDVWGNEIEGCVEYDANKLVLL